MSEKEAIKRSAIAGANPLLVSAAAAGGLIYGAGKGLQVAKDIGEKAGPTLGMAAVPFTFTAGLVAGPFIAIKKVGDLVTASHNKK